MSPWVARIGGAISRAMAFVLIELAEFYSATLSAVTPGSCRFHPTCSAYAVEAVKIHGPFKGTGLAFLRILRCNPWGPFGDDPVPPRRCGHDHRKSAPLREHDDLHNRIRMT